MPWSITTPTRFFPAAAGVPAHSAAKSGPARGGRDDDAPSPLTEKRHPSTLPSAGRCVPAPAEA